MNTHTIKESDIFSTYAQTWWDESGPFKALHKMNPVRLQYILEHINTQFQNKKLSVLDVGCGGGLVCEPFARLGHAVTGIDLSLPAIQVAQQHARDMGLDIDYKNTSINTLSSSYDVICLLELLEHTDSPKTLLEQAAQALNPGGLIFISTLNRTPFSYIAGILLAEHVLRWAPKGTHQWTKFLKPCEIVLPLKKLNIETQNIQGISWSIVQKQWNTSDQTHGNYILVGKKGGG